MRTHIKKKIIGFCVLLILTVSVTAVNIWQKNKDSVIATSLSKKADISVNTNLLSYNGENYRRKSYVKAILVLGIDSTVDMHYIQDAGSGGQADSIGLIAWDTNSDRLNMVIIPRDTMADIPVTDLNGNIMGSTLQHITLAFAFGDGNEISSDFMKESVSKLFDGLYIDNYFAMNTSAIEKINDNFYKALVDLSKKLGRKEFQSKEWHSCIKEALHEYPEVADVFLYATKEVNAGIYEQICKQMSKITYDGDRSNGSMDSSLVSSKRALIVDAVEKITYSNYHLALDEREALNDGYIYIHDMGFRRDTVNCCLFDMAAVLDGGFEMGEMWYDEPATLSEAFDVIASISMNAVAQIYGGFTIPQIDELLSKYAKKSYDIYFDEYIDIGVDKLKAESIANDKVKKDFENGFFTRSEYDFVGADR